MHCVTNTNPYLNIIIEVILKCITATTKLAKISFSNGELAEIFLLHQIEWLLVCSTFSTFVQSMAQPRSWLASPQHNLLSSPRNICIWVQRPWFRVGWLETTLWLSGRDLRWYQWHFLSAVSVSGIVSFLLTLYKSVDTDTRLYLRSRTSH